MEEEFIYPSDEELAASFVDDLFSAFMTEVRKYPLLPLDEINELKKKYDDGDKEAKTKIVNHNLRLVVSIASRHKYRIKHLDIMDIIQEGVIGLMKAVDRYDPNKGAFSTCAVPWINQAILRAIEDKEDEIRKPVHIGFLIRKYRFLMSKGIPYTDEELRETLDCSEETLKLIKKKANETLVSAQTLVGDDEKNELGDFIAYEEEVSSYDQVINKINDQELLFVLKNKLIPIEYYFLYAYDLDSESEDNTLEKMAKDFNITRERVRQIKKKAYEKAGKYVKNRNLRHKEAEKIAQEYNIPVSKFNVKPCSIKNIILYNYVKNRLDPIEQRILANYLFGNIKMSNKERKDFFFLKDNEYDEIINIIMKKIKDILKDKEAFDTEIENITKMYGTQIFMLIPDDEVLMYDEKKESLEYKIKRAGEKREANKARLDRRINNIIEEAKATDESQDKGIIDIFNEIDINNEELLIIIKNRLSDLEYYIFYQILKNKNNIESTVKRIAKMMNMTVTSLLAYKGRIEKKISKMMLKDDFILKEKSNIEIKYGCSIKEMKIEPITPEEIISFYYLKDCLEEDELSILSNLIFSPYKIDRFINEDIDNFKEKIMTILKREKYERYKRMMIKTYGIKLFNRALERELEDIKYDEIKKKFDGYSFDEIKELYKDAWDNLDINSQNLLKRYFKVPDYEFDNKEDWEERFYLEMEDIKLELDEPHLKPSVLYDCYLKNKDLFSKRDQRYLECSIFGVRKKVEQIDFPENHKSILLDKLEKLYFNVYNMLYSNQFSKEQWLKVLERHEDKFSENRIMAMNMFYGIDGEALSIMEIAEIFGTSYDTMHEFIAKTRKTAISLYINRSGLVDIDRDIYIPYVLDLAYSFVPLTREILIMVLVKEMTYSEVKEELGKKGIKIELNRISNIVKDGLRKIDTYRFNLVDNRVYNKGIVLDYLKANDKRLDDIEKNFVRDKFINHKDSDSLAIKYQLPKNKINKQTQRYMLALDKFMVKDVVLTEEDYLREFNTYPLERVVDEKQMHMLSYYYGIRCKYNPLGEKLSTSQMINKLGEYHNDDIQGLSRKIKKANDLIKAKKLGIYHNDLVFMPTDEVRKIMNDPHVPISDKERYIICSIYGIKHYAKKTLEELAKIYNETENSIRRRYIRAFTAICKYQKGEIPDKIDYEYDILPIMRYFSKYDRKLLEDYYKKNLSYEKIAKKYKLTYNQVTTRFNRLHLCVYEMINNPKGEYFDYDLYEKAIKDPLFPYYANLEEDVKIFDRCFANTQVNYYTANEIIKDLNLNRDRKSVHKSIYNLIMAVCRYKYGIRKKHTFTYEDVVDYYERHKEEMVPSQKKVYLLYFKRHLMEYAGRNKEYITKSIVKDIIKERKKNIVDVEDLDYEEMLNLIRTRHFSSKVLNGLLHKMGETEKVIMSGQELNHVYRLLNRLDKSLEIESKQRLVFANK